MWLRNTGILLSLLIFGLRRDKKRRQVTSTILPAALMPLNSLLPPLSARGVGSLGLASYQQNTQKRHDVTPVLTVCHVQGCLAARLSGACLSHVGLEAASCPHSSSHTETDSNRNLTEFGSGSFPSPAAHVPMALTETWMQPGEILKQKTNPKPRLSFWPTWTEIINVLFWTTKFGIICGVVTGQEYKSLASNVKQLPH